MGLVKMELARISLPDREAHNSRMFVDLCENIHIHYRESRIVFSLDEYFEFVDILTRSTEDVRSYLAQNPDYEEGRYPTTVMVAGGKNQQRKLLQNSPAPNRSTYFANDFTIELQDESVVDEIHVHWRDYRFAMPRDHLKLICDAFTQAKAALESFEADNDYKRRPHRDRKMEDFAREREKYASHQPGIMGEKAIPISQIRTRFDDRGGSWRRNEEAIEHLARCYINHRLMPPVIVSTERNGEHHIIDGNHRLTAAKRAGLSELNCIVTDMTFKESELFRKAEHLLKAFDEATGFRYNTSGFNRQFFAYRASRYYADHFHGLFLPKPKKPKPKKPKDVPTTPELTTVRHASQSSDHGRASEELFPHIQPLIRQLPPVHSILHYGCGRSRLVDWLAKCNDARPRRYDPAIPKFAKLPRQKVSLVINTDVLEHTPEDELDATLARISSLSKRVYFRIATVPAGATLRDSENAPCTIRPAEWWHATLRKHFPDVRPAPPKQKDRCAFVTWKNAPAQNRDASLKALKEFCGKVDSQDCIVFGSAPEPHFGAEGYRDEKIITCNGSSLTLLQRFGLAPDCSFVHSHALARENEADRDVRNALSQVPQLGRAVFFTTAKCSFSDDTLASASEDRLRFDWDYRFDLIRRLLGSSFPLLDVSTDAIAVACTLFAGARSVRLVGFSFDPEGHSHKSNGLYRNHVSSDAALYAMLTLAGFKISATDPSVQTILTSKVD